MAQLSTSYSLQQFIDSGSKVSITYGKFSTTETVGDIKFPSYHVVDDYLDEIKSYAVDVELTKDEYFKYKYRPKILAYDVYGSTELDFIILALNGLADMKDFDLRTVKLLKKTYMTNIISSIYNSEVGFIQSNQN
jgi:hypothetical protein